MSDQPRINGKTYTWASITLKVGGQPYYGVKSIAYGDKLEHGLGYGMGRHHGPRARGVGKYTPDPVQITAEKATVVALKKALAALSTTGTSFGEPEFQIVVEATEGGISFVDTIQRCKWQGNTVKREENPDPLYDDVEFSCMWIDHDGQHLFDDTDGTPG